MKLAPIVLFVYNRPRHTSQTLEALARNEGASDSILYIFADGPKGNASVEEMSKINETRKIIKSKQWCKKVSINERENNIGLASSIMEGVTEIVNKYGKIIILEDDIITSRVFLRFMNDALAYYQNHEKVAGISGFKYPSEPNFQKVHFLPIGCSWGWATWEKCWDETEFDAKKLLQMIEEKKLASDLNFGGYEFYNMLKNQVDGLIDSWAIRFYTSFFIANKYFVYPPVSLVQNAGFDNFATNTATNDNFFDLVKTGISNYEFSEPILGIESLYVKNAFENKYLNYGFTENKKTKSGMYYVKKIAQLFKSKIRNN
ncbi:glycosyltransferase [soil metagenome]